MIELNGMTPDIAQKNLEQLKKLFPEVFTEGKIDFDKLKQVLGEYVDDNKERYNFTWNGKSRALRLAQTPSTGTLRPCKEDSKGWDTTENLYIEGDNLEVLKLLQKSYHNKIKMIYIDPPYNTGKEFVYQDKFTDGVKNYKKITEQIDFSGCLISSNTESNGRYHTDWLNMIYPRLRLARNLLTEKGAIFISIDENEVSNLKKVCDEIFGEENFVSCISRATGTPTGGGNKAVVNEMDYLLVFAKNWQSLDIEGLPMTDDDARIYDQEDELGKYLIRPLRRTGGEDRREDRPSMYFGLEAPDKSIVYPIGPTGYESRWICGKSTYEELVKNNRIAWRQITKDGITKWQVYQKFYLENRKKQPSNLWNDIEGNKKATRECKSLFEDIKVFDFPKPVELIERIIHMCAEDSKSIIMDFFSGSATTAHAVMRLNCIENKKRKFIMVQLPEPCGGTTDANKLGYKNICEIGKERIRRAGEKIKEEAGLMAQDLDIGFKVFKLDSSNLNKWNPDYNDLETSLYDSINNYVAGRTEMDVVYEIMIKMGLDLTYSVVEHIIADKKVYEIGAGAIMLCLDDEITTDVAQGMIKLKNELQPEIWKVVFKDNGFASDSNKTNIKEILKCAGLKEEAFTTV